MGGDGYETCLSDVYEARPPPTLALPHEGGGDHKAFCTSVFLLIQVIVSAMTRRIVLRARETAQ